jgi:hypothetical protein
LYSPAFGDGAHGKFAGQGLQTADSQAQNITWWVLKPLSKFIHPQTERQNIDDAPSPIADAKDLQENSWRDGFSPRCLNPSQKTSLPSLCSQITAQDRVSFQSLMRAFCDAKESMDLGVDFTWTRIHLG